MKRALAMMLLASCSGAEKPWERSWPQEPVSQVEDRKPLADGRYPIDLATVLRLAGANNLDIAYVREKVHEAYARDILAWERFVPVIGPEFTYRRHEGLTQGTDGTFVDVDKQQTFLGGRLRLKWEIGDHLFASFAASQRLEGSREMLQATEASVALHAGLAYYDLLREQLRIRVLEESVRISRQLEKELDAAVQAGRGFKGDVLRASVQASSSQIALERARESMKLAGIRLGSLLRLGPGIELVAAEEDPKALEFFDLKGNEADRIRQALESRPEIREALAEWRATAHERDGATWGPFFPDVMVDLAPGSLGPVASDLESSRDYVVTFGWRIGPGGILDLGRQDLYDARTRQARIQLERVRQKIVDEVRSAWTQVEARAKLLDLARQGMRDAEEALKLNQERQAANIGLPLEVVQAEESVTRARLDYYTVVVEYNQAQLRLLVATGRKP